MLMDLLMEPMDGIAATAAIKERDPEVEMVAVTSVVEEEKVHAALEAGAAGYPLSRTQRPIRRCEVAPADGVHGAITSRVIRPSTIVNSHRRSAVPPGKLPVSRPWIR